MDKIPDKNFKYVTKRSRIPLRPITNQQDITVFSPEPNRAIEDSSESDLDIEKMVAEQIPPEFCVHSESKENWKTKLRDRLKKERELKKSKVVICKNTPSNEEQNNIILEDMNKDFDAFINRFQESKFKLRAVCKRPYASTTLRSINRIQQNLRILSRELKQMRE